MELEVPPTTATEQSSPVRVQPSTARPRGRWLLSVRLALAAGLALVAVALGLLLSSSPLTVAGTNGIPAHLAITYTRSSNLGCQRFGVLPQGTEAIRVSLSANTGPRVNLKVFSASTLVAEGEREAGWGIDETVTVPIRRLSQAIFGGRICTTVGPGQEPLQINGSRVRVAGGEGYLLRMEYMRRGPRSWLSLASSAIHNMGLEHAPSGTWATYLAIVAMLAVAVIASRLLLREARLSTLGKPDRRLLKIPWAAWTCAVVAVLSAACWSVITPPFQSPDEPSHFAYVQLLAETGRLPTSNREGFSEEELHVLKDLNQREIEWHPEVPTITSLSAQRQLDEDLLLPLNRVGPGGAGVAASEPPLYYALETIPYELGSGGTLLDRLELMRLLSALLAGLSALFTFLFVRECLPGVRWAWTVAGLAAALVAPFGFASGAVTPDALLYPVTAAVFLCLARAFRRGLTRKRAVALGVAIAAGFLTKLNFIGLAPGVMLGLVVLAFRGRPATAEGDGSRRAFGAMAIAMAIAVSPICVYVLSNLLEHHHALGLVSSSASEAGKTGSLLSNVSFVWGMYLPHLPGMLNEFPGISMIHESWFNRMVGLYGWIDTSFPVWVDNLALIPAGLIVILALCAVAVCRRALRHRLSEILVYVVMSVGLLALIGQDAYSHRLTEGGGWEQPRYLIPLLPLAAIVLALAARGAGKRWGGAVGVLIVILFFAQDVFSQLLVVARFYL